MRVPADVYQASSKRLNEKIKFDLYDQSDETKKVSDSDYINFDGRQCFIGEAFKRQEVLLERLCSLLKVYGMVGRIKEE